MALMPFRRSNSSIPSSSSSQFRYNVFLSFRGTDTRHNFISHLYKELIREGIETFKDDGELERGKEISPDLLEAIEKSRYSIVVISKNYGSSKWCLDELVKILECQNPKEPTVYPVFFHVNPSEVGKQTGTFGEGFAQLVSKHAMEIERVQIWKEALKKAAKVSGFVYPDPQFESESKLIEEIVGKIIPCENPSVDEGLVGMNSRIKKAIEWLDLGENDGCVVGIWGMGGIGKTTLARAVFDRISCQFDGKCFLENVRAVSKERSVMYLQEQLLREISKGKVHKVNNIKSGQNMIERIIGGKKVLIVLDDVDTSIGVEDLLGKHDWFNSGRKIIITGRDLHVLRKNGAKLSYMVPRLKEDEAVKLFKSKAFSKDKQTEGYENNIGRAVEYCNGLPLALKVLGSVLHDREEIYWECTLKKLEKMPLSKVEEVLKISYDDLDEEDKKIFLHIAFFFQRKLKYAVTNILESLGFQPILGIKHLVEKSLISVSLLGELIMHDLIQDFGRNIVRQESPEEPGQRSRLWLFDDIKSVLMNDTGTEKVEGIVMEHPNRGIRAPNDFGSPKELTLGAKAFQKLRKLKILIIRDVHLLKDLEYLPNELRYLDWVGYPSRCMPSKFQPMHLVELHMTRSNIKQLWTETEVLPSLKVLDLGRSEDLTVCPDFRTVPNLEELMLDHCSRLVDLHPSIGSLGMLDLLYLEGCMDLKSIPNSIGQTKSLTVLDLAGCSLENFPCSICSLSSLTHLYLDGCSFESLPTTMNQLSELVYLGLSGCERLQELPELSSNIETVCADDCESLRTIASPSIYKSFAIFSFINCFKLVESKESKMLTDKFLSNQFQGGHVRKTDGFKILFPGSKIPKWFKHQSKGSSICLPLPPNWFNSSSLLGIAVVTVNVGIDAVVNTYDMWSGESFYNHRILKSPTTSTLLIKQDLFPSTPGRKSESVVVRYFTRQEIQVLSVTKVDDELNENGVKFESKENEVKKCGIRLVYKEDVEWNDQAYGSNPRYEDVYAPLETRLSSLLYIRALELFGLFGDKEEEEEEEEDEDEDEDEADVDVDVDVEEANNVLLKRRPSGSCDFQKEDCPNVKRPRLDQEFNTRRVTLPPNEGNSS